MFNYEFMRVAFVVGILLAIAIPLIGVTVVLKRLSMIGDALSHASLAGILGGMVIGINPVLGAMVTSLLAALAVEMIRRKFAKYAELSIAIVTSAALGIAGILMSLLSNATSFNRFLFGSIVAITQEEMWMVILITALVILVSIYLYQKLFYMAFDEESAQLSGINTNIINIIFTILTALVVSLASRTVGALIVSSLMVIPVSCAMIVSKSYKQTILYSVGFAVLFMIVGLTVSYNQGIAPGGSIVVAGLTVLVVLFIFKKILMRNT